MTINVVLADDHPLIRAGIKSALLASPEIALVGEAADGDEARRFCQENDPDILLLDICMPGSSAAETIDFLNENKPDVKVIILTAYDDEAYVRTFISLGVKGYILKDVATEAVLRAVNAVMSGDTWFSPHVIQVLAKSSENKRQTEPLVAVCERQAEILALLQDGLKTGQIAEKLGLSDRTIRYHIENVLEKLGAKNRVEAVSKAVKAGII